MASSLIYFPASDSESSAATLVSKQLQHLNYQQSQRFQYKCRLYLPVTGEGGMLVLTREGTDESYALNTLNTQEFDIADVVSGDSGLLRIINKLKNQWNCRQTAQIEVTCLIRELCIPRASLS
jgi:hypothetical protein